MNQMLAPVFLLLLLDVTVSVWSLEDSVQVVSFRKSRKTQDGPVMCALDAANETTSSSSLQDCSLSCTSDVTCTGFNIKDSQTCDVYNYNVKVIAHVSTCINYQKVTHDKIDCLQFGNDATSIPAECCDVPYIVNGSLYYNCSVNAAFSSDFGCYNNNGQWVTCLQPEDFVAEYEEISSTALSADPAVVVPLLTINNWILMQRKVKLGLSSVSFNQTWAAYRDGFGSPSGNDNYWLGLDKVYHLMQLGSVRLRVEVQRNTSLWYWAEYSTFSISDEASKYQLTVDGYSGDAGDAMAAALYSQWNANGMMFSTADSDNDAWVAGSCAAYHGGGSWFNTCIVSHLTKDDSAIWSTGTNVLDVDASRMLVTVY